MPVHLVPYLVSSGSFISMAHRNAIALVSVLLAVIILRRWTAGKDLIARLDLVHQRQEKDLHGTTWLVCCSLIDSPVATLLLSNLASRGAQLVVLLPASQFEPAVFPSILELLHLLRNGTRNELIFAEQCDLLDLGSVSAFIEAWQQGEGGSGLGAGPLGDKAASGIASPAVEYGDPSRPSLNPRRCDGIVLLPYTLAQSNRRLRSPDNSQHSIDQELLGRFHLVNSLLPSLLLLPPERDIRIVSWISPWYAAGIKKFHDASRQSFKVPSPAAWSHGKTSGTKAFASENTRVRQARNANSATARNETSTQSYNVGMPVGLPSVSDLGATTLTMLLLNLELQRRLIILAEADSRPRNPLLGILNDELSPFGTSKVSSVPVGEARRTGRRHWPNVNVINICPGFERDGEVFQWVWPSADTLATASPTSTLSFYLRRIAVVLLWPIIFVLAKSPKAAVEQFVWGIVAPLNVQAGCKFILEQTQGSSEERRKQEDASVGSGSIRLDSSSWSHEPEEGDTIHGPWKGIQPGRLYREGRLVQLPIAVQSQEGLSQLWVQWEERIKKSLGKPIGRAGSTRT